VASHILIVEDDEDIREVLATLLAGEGYSVATAMEGRHALSLLAAGPTPSLILLDLMMPGMNGWDFLATLPSHPAFAAIPVVVLSATTNSPPPGASEFLPKPVDLGRLLDVVKQYAGKEGASAG
jgi:CheY-like chemotaxis protein